MTRTDLTRTAAAIACTIVMSATCILSAVAPAQVGAEKPVAAARQLA